MIDLTQDEGEPAALFLLRLQLGQQRLKGELTRLGAVSTVSFDGWLDFMTVLEELRTQTQRGTEGQLQGSETREPGSERI